MFSILPGALALLNGFVLLFYPLTREKTELMARELSARREATEAS